MDQDPGDESDSGWPRTWTCTIGGCWWQAHPTLFGLHWEWHVPDDDGMGDCHGYHRLEDASGKPCTDPEVVREVMGYYIPPSN